MGNWNWYWLSQRSLIIITYFDLKWHDSKPHKIRSKTNPQGTGAWNHPRSLHALDYYKECRGQNTNKNVATDQASSIVSANAPSLAYLILMTSCSSWVRNDGFLCCYILLSGSTNKYGLMNTLTFMWKARWTQVTIRPRSNSLMPPIADDKQGRWGLGRVGAGTMWIIRIFVALQKSWNSAKNSWKILWVKEHLV